MSAGHESFIGEGDYENYKAKMQLAQMVHPHVNYLPDRLSVLFVSRGTVWNDVAANYPLEGNLLVFYFEMRVLKITEGGGLVGIGLCGKGFPSNKIPGLSDTAGFSMSYISTSDIISSDHVGLRLIQQREKFKKFKEGDVVGCGLNSYSNEIFFTLNGELLPFHFPNTSEEELYPTVGMKGVGCSLTVNFGKAPFSFDLESLIKATKTGIVQEILDEDVKADDIQYLIKNYLEVYGYDQTLKQFEPKDEESFKSFLMNKKDFKTEDIHKEQPATQRSMRKFTDDLIGLELSRVENIDFWAPDNIRKTSTYSNPGVDKIQRKTSVEEASEMVGKRSAIKKVILTGTLEEINKLIEFDLVLLLKIFPEIKLQAELLSLSQILKTQGLIPVVKAIRDKYSELSSEVILLHDNTEILHLTIGQLVSRLILNKEPAKLDSLFDLANLRIALWEKVNSSILKQNDFLAVSCLDVINGHFDFLKGILKEKNDSCYRLAEKPQDFRLISAAFSITKPK